jgi:hypothetical protein
MNSKGQISGPALNVLVGLMVGGAVVQAAEPIAIHPVVWDILRAVVGVFVLAIGFYVRGIYKNSEKEREQRHQLELRLKELETLCPFHQALQRGAPDVPQLRKAVNDSVVRGSDT